MKNEKPRGYVKPEIRTLRAGDIVESLGPVAAGSSLSPSASGSSCGISDQLLGKDDC